MTFTYVPAIDLTDEAPATYFEITLCSGRTIEVHDASTYQPEGPLTTFFRTASSSPTIDVWSERIASFRTADITSIHQCTVTGRTHPSAQNLPADEIDLREGRHLALVSA